MRHSPLALCAEREVEEISCSVCGSYVARGAALCDECVEWKDRADKLRAAKARRKVFGDIL